VGARGWLLFGLVGKFTCLAAYLLGAAGKKYGDPSGIDLLI
jgi:hypothetical protein